MTVPAARLRRGRPRLEDDQRRERRVVTFVTQAELEQLEDLASRQERSLSAIVHRMIVAQLHRFRESARSGDSGED